MKIHILFASALLLGSALFAQEYRGTFSGNVTDAQGASIPNAKIVITETRTGTKSNTVSGPTGKYTVPFLSLGTYDIEAEAAGFKKFQQKGLTLSAGENPVIDIKLEVGALSEEVTVTAEAPVMITSSPSLGQVITGAEVEDVPVNGRTPGMLGNLAMGVISTFEPGPVRPFDNSAVNDITIGGAPAVHNEMLLNGAPNAGQANQMAYSPMQDAVTEVRVAAFDMDAANGHAMGGSVNVITKSGTNGLHGSAYIYNQTSAVDANTFFNNRSGVKRPQYHQNQYGITAGGPVLVPKIFNGKNRVFWFFGWEGMRDSDPADSPVETGSPEDFTSVPTAAERTGDFSALAKLPTNPAIIYDPNTGVLSGTLVTRTPFPGNIIPSNRISPIAQAYMNYFPAANGPGLSNGSGQNNYIVTAVDSDGYDNELGRMDISISDRNRLSIDARHSNRAQNKGPYFGNQATGNYLYRINQGTTIEDIATISPTLVSDFRFNWTRYFENHASPSDGIDPTSLGFPSYIDATSEFKMLPYITFLSTSVAAGARATFEPLGYNGDGTNVNDIFQIYEQIVKIHGNHTIKMGVDARQYRWSAYTFNNPSGTYAFSGTWVNSAIPVNGVLTAGTNVFGQDLAEFMLGIPSGGSLDLNTQTTVQANFLGLYLNDDWRVKNNLTLNLGIRFDHDYPERERWNRTVNGFDPNANNGLNVAAAAAYAANPQPQWPAANFHPTGGLTFASSSSPDIYSTKSHIFSPRVGFAWTPHLFDDKTVIRGGVGVLVDPVQLPTPISPGFSQNTPIPTETSLLPPPPSTLANPFPTGFLQPSGSSKGAATSLGTAISFIDPNLVNPYNIRWELSLQRQLPGALVLEVAYIGSHSVHEAISTNLNYIPRQFMSTSLGRDNTVITELTGTLPTNSNPFKGLIPSVSALNGSTTTLQSLVVPFPQFSVNGITELNNPAGSGYYESLNVRLQKRYGHGLILINNFIWNRMEDRLAYLNPSDPQPEKRLSSDSRPLREVMTATYELPIGHGKKLNLQNRWVDTLIGGWKTSGVLTLQSGPLLTWGNYIYYGGPLHLNAHQPNGVAFDTTQFNMVAAQQLADNIQTFDLQYNNLRRDPVKQVDTSLDKNFRFGEKRYLQVRFEAFNLTNHVTFGGPNTAPTNAAFGTIGSQANTPRRLETALRLVW